MSGLIVPPFAEVLLCRHEIEFMLLHRRQHAQVALYSAVAIVSDVVLNHGNKLLAACEASSIVPLPLENAPETLHWAIADAFSNSGHALLLLRSFQLAVKSSVGILESSVTMEQWMCIRIGLNSSIQGVKYKGIIITIQDNESNDSTVIQSLLSCFAPLLKGKSLLCTVRFGYARWRFGYFSGSSQTQYIPIPYIKQSSYGYTQKKRRNRQNTKGEYG